MHSSRWMALAAFILILGSSRFAFSSPESGAKISEVVEGYGPNAAKASERAEENAEKLVETWLRQRYGDHNWQSGKEPLDAGTLSKHGVIRPLGQPTPTTLAAFKGQPSLVARVRVEVTEGYLETVQHHLRQQRVHQRQGVLARILAALVVVLLVVVGYLRLDEATAGYFTRILRIASLVILALAALALVLTL